MSDLAHVFYVNALKLLDAERRKSRRIDEVYRTLARHNVQADLVDWLANPFIRTALQILRKFSDNYKIQEATRLLYEAGEEASAAASKKKKR